MPDYLIAHQSTVCESIRLFLLNIPQNAAHCNPSIVPAVQVEELNRYKFNYDRDKRLLARSFLYEHLFNEYGVSNFELDFNEYKKPFVKAARGIGFSFSYSKEYLLIGIAHGRKLGVDIEYIDPRLNVQALAKEIMCPAELAMFNSFGNNPLEQRVFFFTVFSGKESVIKSYGTGLYYDVRNLDLLNTSTHSYMDAKFIYQHLGLWLNEYSMALSYEL